MRDRYRAQEETFAKTMDDRREWERATEHSRHLAIAADADPRGRPAVRRLAGSGQLTAAWACGMGGTPARFLLWLLTAAEGEEVPVRFRSYDISPSPAVAEHGSVTVTVTEVYRDEGFRPLR